MDLRINPASCLAGVAIASGLCLGSVTPVAAEMTRNQYATAWRDACVAGGVSSKIALSEHEKLEMQMTFAFYEAYLAARKVVEKTGIPKISTLLKEPCGCWAKEVASKKKSISSETPDSVVDNAMEKCRVLEGPEMP